MTVGRAVRLLTEQGLIKATEEGARKGKGKPAQLFSPSPRLFIGVARLWEKDRSLYLYNLKTKRCERLSYKLPDRCRGKDEELSFIYTQLLQSAAFEGHSRRLLCAVLITDRAAFPPLECKRSDGSVSLFSEGGTNVAQNGLPPCVTVDRRQLEASALSRELSFEKALFIELNDGGAEAFLYCDKRIVSRFDPFRLLALRDAPPDSDPEALGLVAPVLFDIFSPDALFVVSEALSETEICRIRELCRDRLPCEALFFLSSRDDSLVRLAAETALGIG